MDLDSLLGDAIAEIDGLDTEKPDVFALANRRLPDSCDIRILGGGCGTGPAHLEAIAERILLNRSL